MHRYRSSRYPGVPAAALAGLAIGRPLALCMLPLMIVSLVAMLDGRDPLPLLLWAVPVAVAVAWFWTRQELRGTVVEVLVDRSAVVLRSAWEAASGRTGRAGEAVLDVRRERDRILVTVGLETYRIETRDFADPDALFDRLEEARRVHVLEVRSRIGEEAASGGPGR